MKKVKFLIVLAIIGLLVTGCGKMSKKSLRKTKFHMLLERPGPPTLSTERQEVPWKREKMKDVLL